MNRFDIIIGLFHCEDLKTQKGNSANQFLNPVWPSAALFALCGPSAALCCPVFAPVCITGLFGNVSVGFELVYTRVCLFWATVFVLYCCIPAEGLRVHGLCFLIMITIISLTGRLGHHCRPAFTVSPSSKHSYMLTDTGAVQSRDQAKNQADGAPIWLLMNSFVRL